MLGVVFFEIKPYIFHINICKGEPMKKLALSLLLFCSFGPLFAAKEIKSIRSTKSFDDIIAKGNVVVDFYADWCGPCKRMTPVFCSLSEEFSNVTFIKVNIDDNKSIADRYGVKSIPTFIFFKDGKKVHTITGFKNKPVMRKALKKHF